VASAAVLMVWRKSIFAPATKLSFLPEMKTTAFTAGSFSARESSDANASPVSGESVFTDSPGRSNTRTATVSSTW